MGSMKELLGTYTETIDKIFKNFGIEDGYGEIDIMDSVKWNMDDETVRWSENDDMYSNEIRRDVLYFENYVLLYVDNGCGDMFYQIFDTNLRDETLDEDY
jgi:hypothetical protein